MAFVENIGESPLAISLKLYGANRTRTGGFHNAIVTLYQLSYSPSIRVYYIRLCCCFSQENYQLS